MLAYCVLVDLSALQVTNQMVRRCKQHILAPGKLWDQERTSLISNMQAS